MPCPAYSYSYRGTRLRSANAHRMNVPADVNSACAWSQVIASESSWPQPNNSFKPRPLRGSAAWVTCTTPPFRAAVRLNSGVRLGQDRFSPKRFLHWQRAWLLLCALGFLPCSASSRFWRGTRLQSANAHRIGIRRDLKFTLAWPQMVASQSSWPQPNNSFKPRPLRGSA